MLLPGSFLPLSLESGLTGELDLLIIEKVLAAMPLLAKPIPRREMVLSVNLSGVLLEDEELRRRLLALVDDNPRLPGWTLQVELLEDSFQDTSSSFERFLNDLVARGISIAIDDFGTGYSSLARLITLPIQGVKVDRAFVDRIDDTEESPRTLLRTMLAMLADLGLTVTAEGVESDSQRRWLVENGVSKAQGFFFDQPLSIGEAIQGLSEVDYRPRAIPVQPGAASGRRRPQLRSLFPWRRRQAAVKPDNDRRQQPS